jgi:transketolase
VDFVWVRALDGLTARPLPGSDRASFASPPFWSPDSESVGFFAEGKVKRIDIAGGPPFVLADAPGGTPEVVLMSSGSEVSLILDAQKKLEADGIRARAVSMPSHEIFARQDQAYRDSVLPKGIKRIAIEAAHPMSWYKWVGDEGVIIGLERFGASAPGPTIYEHLGITVDHTVQAAKALVGKK